MDKTLQNRIEFCDEKVKDIEKRLENHSDYEYCNTVYTKDIELLIMHIKDLKKALNEKNGYH